MSFNPAPTPRRPSAAQGQHNSSTPAAASRFRSSLVTMHRASPMRSAQSSSRVTPALSGPAPVRDLFRTTTTPKPSRTTSFAPNIPASVTKAPASIRKLVTKGNSGGLAATASQELFKVNIPEPDPELTGEALAKAIPDNMKKRRGTVYADQYLAHKCPPEFDEAQRRQFFCILDLRRLKFAANEIFTAKDWQINVMNFAKEYEKSRGLIMLRYGLYEFKNVRPSEDIMKKWRKAHNLPDPAPQPEKSVPKTPLGATSTKRKAEEDLEPKDNTLQASTFNQNKRRNVEQEPTDDAPKFAPSPIKSKRKVDETDKAEESQCKAQKGTPSAARSKLEGIINSVQSGTSTPAGSPAKKPLFGASTNDGATPSAPLFGLPKAGDAPSSPFATKSNPFGASTNGIVGVTKLESTQFQPGRSLNGASAGSVLSSHKIGSAPAAKSNNIFGYLSESSANNSAAENADGETDSGSDSESQPDTGSQDAPPSYEPSAAASTGTATPPITGGQERSSLFGLGKPAPSSNPFASAFNKPPSEKPTDSAPKGGLFGRVSFGANGQPLRETASEEVPQSTEEAVEEKPTITPAKPPGDYTFNPTTTPISFSKGGSSIFGAKAADETAQESKEPEKAAPIPTSSLFGNPQPQPAASQLFGAKPSDQSASSQPAVQSLFGNSFEKTTEPEKQAESEKPAAAPTSLFGSQPSAASQQPAQPLFGNLNKSTEAGKAESAPITSFFGEPKKTPEPEKAEAAPASSFFGAPKPVSSPFSFGSTPASTTPFGEAAKPAEPEAPATQEPPKSFFGASQPSFGASTTNGSTTPANDQPKNLFGSQSLFGSSNAATGASSPAPAAASAPIFGGFKASTEPPPPASNVFGQSNASPGIFAANATNGASTTNFFGAASSPFPAANTGTPGKRRAEEDIHPSKKPMFGRSEADNSTGAQPSAPTFSFGSQSGADSQAEKKSMFSSVMGGGDSTPVGSPVPGRKILTPKRLQRHGSASQQSQPAMPSGSNMFGSPAPSPAPPAGSASFTFGAQNNAPSANQNATSFTFGQSDAGVNGSSAGNNAFTFGGGAAAPAGGSSFTFGAGGNGGSNPFAGTNGPSTQSFGGSATPTPSGSFNFQFGGQGPSTPAPAEQNKPMFGGGAAPAPTFSFTSATPDQSGSNAFASKPSAPSIFSGLQPSNGAPGASKEFWGRF
jgi:hypothetical protein